MEPDKFFKVVCGLILVVSAHYTFCEEEYCNTTPDVESEEVGTNQTISRHRERRAVTPDQAGIKFDTKWIPWEEYYHWPNQIAGYNEEWQVWTNPKVPMREINGTALPADTPDFRIIEPNIIPVSPKYFEENRYYRIQPLNIYNWKSYRSAEEPFLFNCYCVIVFKRLQPLAMGAILTYRHILTSALATDIVLRKYRHKKTLENILGAWYNSDSYSSSHKNQVYYITPGRIAYHPLWNPPEFTNRSVPLPCLYDLAVWTTTRRLRHAYGGAGWFGGLIGGGSGNGYYLQLCQRWSNHWLYGPSRGPKLQSGDLAIMIGVQMVVNIGRKPYPWFRYAIRTKTGILPICPKAEWDWYNCIEMRGPAGSMGMEPGGILHVYSGTRTKYSGLAGLNSVSMKLRSAHVVNYFTIIDRHSVLDFIYDAYKSFVRPSYVDARFIDKPGKILELYGKGQTLIWEDPEPKEHENYDPLWYK